MTAAPEDGEWSASRLGRTLPPGKTRYPLYRRLGGPQGRSGRVENLAPPGFDPRSSSPYSFAIATELPGPHTHINIYTGCNRRNVRDFGRVFLRSNYTDITQNTSIQSWTVTEIMAIEMCGLLGCRRTVRRPWCHTCPMRLPGNETW